MDRMTWEEIKKKYPHQYVGLCDVKYVNNDGITVESGIVKYTKENISEDDMLKLAMDKKIIRRYTSLEDIPEMGVLRH